MSTAGDTYYQRYHALRALGYSGKESSLGCKPGRFVELVQAKGIDPSTYGDLSWPRRGGFVSVIGPTPSMLRAQALRELGATPEQVARGRQSRGRFEHVCRHLAALRRRVA